MEENKKGKNIILWIIGVFFILSAISYIQEITILSLLLMIVGIILLPPINKSVKEKLSDEKKIKSYNIIKNIFSVIIFFAFTLNISSNTLLQSENKVIVNEINQNEIDNSLSVITNTNGKYSGEIVNGKKEGKGKYEWNDGSIYEGEFLNDQINGKGKLEIPDKGKYEGTFKDGKKNGQGVYTFSNGDIYNGNWVDDKMSGNGTYTFSNGDKYEGEFSDNKFNGQGTYTKGTNKYTGKWKDNEYQK